MSPIALLYILLASPIFSENIYSRHHLGEELLPVSHYSLKNIERLFRTSPLESILSTSTTPSWLRRSNVFGRRSIVNELYPESSIFDEVSTFEPIMRHFTLRNVEVIRRLAETHPEMINVVIEKLLRPESRLWAEKLIRHVEPESLLFSHKLINKLPVYLREKIVRRLVKSVLPWTASTRRSILSEVLPIEESTLFESPIMTKVLSEKLIRRNVEKKIVKKIVKKALRMIKKSVSPVHFNVESMLHSTFSPINKMFFKSSTEKRILKKLVKKIVKNVLRHKRTAGYTPMPWSNKWSKVCMMCNTCMYNWTPMCNMCESVCDNWMTPSFTPEFTTSYFGKNVYGEKKIVKKLIKKLNKLNKLSTEELLF